jgi:hypothetical protein
MAAAAREAKVQGRQETRLSYPQANGLGSRCPGTKQAALTFDSCRSVAAINCHRNRREFAPNGWRQTL